MSTNPHHVEIVRVRPKSDEARAELLAIRPTMLSEYDQHWPEKYTAELFELEDGSWLDVWSWETRELAEFALAQDALIPTFVRWRELVEPLGFDWARALATKG